MPLLENNQPQGGNCSDYLILDAFPTTVRSEVYHPLLSVNLFWWCLIISAAALVEEPEEEVVDVERRQTEAETNRNQQKPEEQRRKSEPVKQELTEEDLEDWLDSLIS